MIDGVPQNSLNTLDNNGRRVCSSSNLALFLPHEISINVDFPSPSGNSLSFDGLFYSTLDSPVGSSDAVYTIPNDAITLNVANPGSNVMQTPGDTMSFHFNGKRLSSCVIMREIRVIPRCL